MTDFETNNFIDKPSPQFGMILPFEYPTLQFEGRNKKWQDKARRSNNGGICGVDVLNKEGRRNRKTWEKM